MLAGGGDTGTKFPLHKKKTVSQSVVSLCGTQNADSVSGSLSIVCLFYVLLFSSNKILIRKAKKKNIFGVLPTLIMLINPSASERFVYIIIHLHLVFQFDRINSLSGNFYLSSLVDFSALWTNISAGVTTIYNRSLYFSSISSPGASRFENEKT